MNKRMSPLAVLMTLACSPLPFRPNPLKSAARPQ